jgi:hypothetical protein
MQDISVNAAASIVIYRGVEKGRTLALWGSPSDDLTESRVGGLPWR